MSGDVQPRKRKDKKRKKDELGVEEPRGTAAALGEGDVFIHYQHDHGTGGHWCAKIIFFSLLAVLVTLVGLIILENRGLTELEANSVESRYSGVLEGWLEDVPDNDHHDEHTLELKHHDDELSQEIDQDEEHSDEHDQAEDDHHDDEIDQDDDDNDQDDDNNDQDDDNDDSDQEVDDNDQDVDDNDQGDNDYDESNENEDDDNSEQNLDEADKDVEVPAYRRYIRSPRYESDEEVDGNDEVDEYNDDLHTVDENDSIEEDEDIYEEGVENESAEQTEGHYDQSLEDENNVQITEDDDDIEQKIIDGNENNEIDEYDDNNTKEDDENSKEQDENDTRENEDEEEHEDIEDSRVVVEKLEKEISDEDALLTEKETQDGMKEEVSNEALEDVSDDDDGEYLELNDIDEPPPVVEHIKVPAGKPLVEIEEDTASEKPPDTLAEEEEYEKRQEELRRERDEASHLWLKLVVGGALLVATHAVVRRITASRDTQGSDDDEHTIREETPVIDRRMGLISEELSAPATSKEILEETQPAIEEEIFEKVAPVIKSAARIHEVSQDVDDDIESEIKDVSPEPDNEALDKELYSDEDNDEQEEEEFVVEKEGISRHSAHVTQSELQAEPEVDAEEVQEDVEIIDEEQIIDEDIEEEELEYEEEISDVDDTELLSRLEAKYGRLPEHEKPGQTHKDGGNSIEVDWPGEPSESHWREQLDQAEEELRQGDWSSAKRRAGVTQLSGSARAKWLVARALDASAEARRDNNLLSQAITAYLDLLKMNQRLGDDILLKITQRTLDRIRFRGNYLSAEPIYRLLIRRFPDVPDYRNNLTVTFLMANRADLAEEVIKDTLKQWPDDRVALAHYGFVLKTKHNRLEEAVDAFQKALTGDVGPATEPRFYYHLGDSLLLLGRNAEAHEVHKRGAALGHFLSPAQRSLYNVERLKGQPWWNIEQTPYVKLAQALEKSWKQILKEGEAARSLYEKEKEGLKERGEWTQLDLFVRGQEIPDRCKRAPVTCSIVRAEPAAVGCRRGQVKFSLMEAGTHVRPHVGPTNCRLRMHLGLSNTKNTYIRVDQETRQWVAGKVLMFDDSFEHEVWHNGTGARLVLIVDVWHPDLTPAQRRALPAI